MISKPISKLASELTSYHQVYEPETLIHVDQTFGQKFDRHTKTCSMNYKDVLLLSEIETVPGLSFYLEYYLLNYLPIIYLLINITIFFSIFFNTLTPVESLNVVTFQWGWGFRYSLFPSRLYVLRHSPSLWNERGRGVGVRVWSWRVTVCIFLQSTVTSPFESNVLNKRTLCLS